MTARRDFLAFTAGAVAARTVLPLAAKAEPTAHRWPDDLFPPGQHPRLDPHPDRELLVAIAEFEALEREFLGLFEDEAPTYIKDEQERTRLAASIFEAQKPWLEVVCSLRATTLDGMRARMGCCLLENQELDPEAGLQSQYINERLMAVLLRDLMPRSTEA